MKTAFLRRLLPGALAFLLAVSVSSQALAAGKTVVATVLPLQVLAMNVAKERAEVSSLIPPGTDVHDFALRPTDLARLSKADLVIANGAGLDGFITDKLPVAHLAVATRGISLITAEGGAVSPHVWLDPLLASEMVKNISTALARLDPAGREVYQRNAAAYIKRLEALHSEIVEALGKLEKRRLITYHESFDYFARRYGLRYLSLTGPHAEKPLPQRVRKVYDIVREEGVGAVFSEGPSTRAQMETIARDLSVRLCNLKTLDVGKPSEGLYEEAMRENLVSITECLGGK